MSTHQSYADVLVSSLKEMPTLSITSNETIRKCINLNIDNRDIFICSYPKSGTTWTQHIVLSLLMLHRRRLLLFDKSKSEKNNDTIIQNNNDEDHEDNHDLPYQHVSHFAPFFEADKYWKNDGDTMIDSIQENHMNLGYRVYNTHLRGNMIPKKSHNITNHDDISRINQGSGGRGGGGGAKCIYIVRSPLDVCVSFYHHLSNQVEGGFGQSFDSFFSDWVNGTLPYGSWMDHVLSYAPYFKYTKKAKDTNSPNNDKSSTVENQFLILFYEDMVSDLFSSVQKITSFLDLDTVISAEDIQNILPSFTFDQMKTNINRFQPQSVTWKNNFSFLRKGIVGDSQTTSLLSKHQRDEFQELLQSQRFEEKLKLIIEDQEVVEKIKAIAYAR